MSTLIDINGVASQYNTVQQHHKQTKIQRNINSVLCQCQKEGINRKVILCHLVTAAQTFVIFVSFADDANKAAVNLIVRREEREAEGVVLNEAETQCESA